MVMAHTARQRHSMPSSLPSSTALSTPSTSSSSSSTGPVSKYQLLRRLLTKIHYTAPFSSELLLSHCPPSLTLPMLSHLFLAYSPHLTHYFLSHNFLLTSSSFSLSSLYSLLLHLFDYRPPLSQAQFSSERGYVALKLTLLTDVIHLCTRKHDELARQADAYDLKPPSASTLPRVASLPAHPPQDKENRPQAAALAKEGKPRRRRQPRPSSPIAHSTPDTAPPRQVEATPSNPHHISFTSQGSTPASALSPAMNMGGGQNDPLLSIHAQLRSIAHRTSQVASPPSTPPQRGGGYEELARRLEAVERRVGEEVVGLQGKLEEMTLRLKALEERMGGGGGKAAEEVKEAEAAGAQKEAAGEEKTGVQATNEAKEVKEEVKEREVQRAVPTSGETDDFLSHMQARLAATASLLDQAKRSRRSNTGIQ